MDDSLAALSVEPCAPSAELCAASAELRSCCWQGRVGACPWRFAADFAPWAADRAVTVLQNLNKIVLDKIGFMCYHVIE